MRSGRGLLISLPFVVSMIVLAVNDHFLKHVWPGLVTGKLSDVAGVAMVALLLTAVTGQRAIGFSVTAVAFALLKIVPIVATAATPVLGGTTRTDATDLIALVVLVPLGAWIGRRRPPPGAPSTAWLLPLQVVAVSAAVLATTATSCEGQGVLSVTAVDGVVYATTTGDAYESSDGGTSWRSSDVSSRDEALDLPYHGTRTACLDPDRCVEIGRASDDPAEAVAIVSIEDGERRPILVVSSAQRQTLTTVIKPQCGDGFFSSIAALEQPDGIHVLVSMGVAGVLHYQPDQTWEWVAVGGYGLRAGQLDDEPFGFDAGSTIATDIWDRWPFELVAGLLLLAPVSVALAIIPIVQMARRRRRDPLVGIVTCVVVAVFLAVVSLFAFVFGSGYGNRGGAAIASAFVAAVAVSTVAPLLAWYARARRPADWLPPHPSGRAG